MPFPCNRQFMNTHIFKKLGPLALSRTETRMKKTDNVGSFFLPIINGFILWVLDQFVHSRAVYHSFELLPSLQEALDKTKDLFGNNLKNRLVSSALQTSSSEYGWSKVGSHLFHSSTMIESTRALFLDTAQNVMLWSFLNFSSHLFDALKL